MPTVPPTFTARLRDILQLRFTDLFASLSTRVLRNISPANPAKRLLKALGYLTVRLVGNVFQPIRNPDALNGKVWLYVVSQNNYEALDFLRQTLPSAVVVAGQSKQIGRYNAAVNRLSLRRKILYYWQFPLALVGLMRTEGRRAWRFFDLVFSAVGYYEVYRRALRYYQPRAVVFANDHNDDTRALLLACRAEGVPTAYVQHASVSTNFPPLGFDLSLLEGQDALDKYRQCGPIEGWVELVGMPKADQFLQTKNQRPNVQRVGLACNVHDETEALTTTLTYLVSKFPDLAFTFRAHPSDTRDFNFLQAQHPQLLFSNAKQESVFEFLTKQDALIAADTSTHLEATLLNVVSFYYRFNTHTHTDDYYGYVAHNLIERANTLPELAALLAKYTLHKPIDIYRRAIYYNATLGTPDEGHSRERAARLLEEWLKTMA
ncbi:hypothetical protein MTX78_09130 [Hymenobacter tibetensis]|uniref:Uncharacterized protein n=1 Tax=Hymenobacter tibetensis TaxID=497967 RepID=A0ABY4D327_9BACT|nr:hypothetical protein [Hymenobacter tibetensis]UOG76747.1 hypothetical protein MTX78_09130 [Hymenobacter tibetensis]